MIWRAIFCYKYRHSSTYERLTCEHSIHANIFFKYSSLKNCLKDASKLNISRAWILYKVCRTYWDLYTGILNVNKTLKQCEKRQWRPDFGDTNKLSYEQPLTPHYARKLRSYCTLNTLHTLLPAGKYPDLFKWSLRTCIPSQTERRPSLQCWCVVDVPAMLCGWRLVCPSPLVFQWRLHL